MLSLIILGLYASLYLWDGGPLFFLHTCSMFISFYMCCLLGVSSMKRTRRYRTHMYLQLSALALLLVGFVAIYLNKERKGKGHFWRWAASWHAWIGAATLLSFPLLAAYSWIWVRPVGPISPSSRKLHKTWGKIIVWVFTGAIITGVFKTGCKKWECLHSDVLSWPHLHMAVVIITSILLSLYLTTFPISSNSRTSKYI